MVKPRHDIQRKSHKTVVDYTNNSLDDFQPINVSPSQFLASHEQEVLSTSCLHSFQYQSVEIISKQILTHILNSWDESKIKLYPSYISITPYEHISLKIFSIGLKQISPQRFFPQRDKLLPNLSLKNMYFQVYYTYIL